MRRSLATAAVCGSLLLGACSGVIPRPSRSDRLGSELVGQSLRLETARGQVSTLHFERDGTVRAMFGTNMTPGQWRVQDRQLCFYWGKDYRECWPYTAAFRRGQTASVTSDRGNAVKVTLQ